MPKIEASKRRIRIALKKRRGMKVSGKSIFTIKDTIEKKLKNIYDES